jgi:hypothetical protein
MNIIAKLSYWILQPRKTKKSVISKPSFIKPKPKKMQPLEDLILDALDKFRMEGYAEKLKTSITPESLPSNKDDDHVLEFLYNQIAYYT